MNNIDKLTIKDLSEWIKSNPVPSGKYFGEVGFDTGKTYIEASLYHEHQNARDDNYASLMIMYGTSFLGNFCFDQKPDGTLYYLGGNFEEDYSEFWDALKDEYADIKNALGDLEYKNTEKENEK